MLYRLVVSLSRQQKRAVILSVDGLLIAASYVLASLLLNAGSRAGLFSNAAIYDLTILMSVGITAIALLGLHKIKLNAYQMQGVIESAFVAVLMVGACVGASFVVPEPPSAPRLFIVTAMLFLILSVTARLVMRHVLLAIYRRGNPRKSILIYGAGQTGQQLATALATDDAVEPIAFIDDDRRLQGLMVAGLRVHRPADIASLIDKRNVKRIVLAMPSASRAVQANLSRSLARTGCEVHALPSFADLVASTAKTMSDTKPVDINDLLGRDRLEEALPGVSDTYIDRHILVTGAGGSIGSEVCRQIVSCKPAALVLMDHSELALFEIDRELRSLAPDVHIVSVLGTVCNAALVNETFVDNRIEIVLHAAAYKHVPLVECNAIEGMRNNVLGTKIVADAARVAGVERFILVSTDKAVRPSSMMGASKRFAELLIQDLATRSENTRFSMVRFGNVLGSSGSVIPLFHEQISRGGPVTLTHSDVTRYFMTIPEAVRLVLLAGSFARGGDVFVLDMGQPVPVRQLARKMIESTGHSVRDKDNPDGDIEIEITGLRPGEKLHEELLIGSDMLTTPHPKILRAQESHLSEIEMANAMQALRQAIETRNPELLGKTLMQWIEQAETTEIKSVNE